MRPVGPEPLGPWCSREFASLLLKEGSATLQQTRNSPLRAAAERLQELFQRPGLQRRHRWHLLRSESFVQAGDLPFKKVETQDLHPQPLSP